MGGLNLFHVACTSVKLLKHSFPIILPFNEIALHQPSVIIKMGKPTRPRILEQNLFSLWHEQPQPYISFRLIPGSNNDPSPVFLRLLLYFLCYISDSPKICHFIFVSICAVSWCKNQRSGHSGDPPQSQTLPGNGQQPDSINKGPLFIFFMRPLSYINEDMHVCSGGAGAEGLRG